MIRERRSMVRSKHDGRSAKTILLVDDEPEILAVLEELLLEFGFNVISKPDAIAALAAIREGLSVDVVITDYRMPGMNGDEFILVLKRLLPTLPIIMLTAYGGVEIYLRSLSLGVYEYLNKPVQIKELIRIINSALARTEAADPAENRMAERLNTAAR
jgi:DNA-binding NtrC family response regulator